MKIKITILIFLFFHQAAFAFQADSLIIYNDDSARYINWYNLDPDADSVQGVSTEKAYEEVLEGKDSRTVIVAIIDSGADIKHEDIDDKIWVNDDEIANNGIDDDNNGYIDDIHGWNFLGNAEGENIINSTLEVTRIYRDLHEKYENADSSEVAPGEAEEYAEYLRIKEEFLEEREKAENEKELLERFELNYLMADSLVKEHLEKDEYAIDELKEIEANAPTFNAAKNYIVALHEQGFTPKVFEEMVERNEIKLNFQLNPDFNAREIIGDDLENTLEWQYGNNDVDGGESDHGTHVAGIIAGERNNGIGINGIAENVELMILRAVPNGDETDKDIANSIIYAANNGAQIINMSFGKYYSPQKHAVDSAVKIAEERGVLLIHSAGNSAADNDEEVTYPTNQYASQEGAASNWITVGATGMEADENLIAVFSNYGDETVDIFAPGVDIYSLQPDSGYALQSGTSMAGPVVTGVAALLMSYYPELDTKQIKEILLASTYQLKKLKVNQPGSTDNKKVKLKDLSISGGVVNAYLAVQMAEEFSKKNRRRQ